MKMILQRSSIGRPGVEGLGEERDGGMESDFHDVQGARWISGRGKEA